VKDVKDIKRCEWPGTDPLYVKYHDEEWGVPVHDDLLHFEFLILEGAQAGLSWSTILNKRENFRKAFDNFDYNKIATYTDQKVEELLTNKGIIRNRLKVGATIANAKSFLKVQKEFGSFDKYIWQFVDGKTIINNFKNLEDLPPKTIMSEQISKNLKKRGFKFVGPTIIYAHMQAIGLVNDHVLNCFRYNEINQLIKK